MSGEDSNTGPLPVASEEDGLDHTGAAPVDAGLDGFHQPTAMFDKGQFLGELADLVDGSPDTRAHVEAAETPPGGCRLIVVAGPDIGLEWAFKSGDITIGRDEDCELSLSDIAVSRRHARIGLEGASFVIEDLGSNNGTFLNGDAIEGRVMLSAGDEIVVGERTLRFVELNEAPPTSAAAPVYPGAEGRAASGIDPGPELDPGGLSQIDAEAAEPDGGPPVPEPAPRGALRRTARVGLAALVLVMAAAGGVYAWRAREAAEAREAREQLARRRFLEAVALVKAERFGDAQRVLTALRALEPGHPRLPAYEAHVKQELDQWAILEEARALASAGRYGEAMETLEAVEPESAYADTAAERARAYARRRARGLLEEARSALERGALDEATALVARVLDVAPGSRDARLLLDAIEAARRGARRPRPKRKKKSFSFPSVLERAVSLYREGRIPAAIDAAEAAGTREAETWVKRLKRMKRLVRASERAHLRKAGTALLDLAPRALALDERIGGGEGDIRRRLTRFFADGLYLEGIEALQEDDAPKAFELFNAALRKWPDHKLAKTRLAELQGRARELYREARTTQARDADRARTLYERVTRITPASNTYHKLAKKWLRGH
jgi:tetratricopeptide (TPR) repeat protein